LRSRYSVPYPFVEQIVNASTLEEYNNLLNETEGYVIPEVIDESSEQNTTESPIGKPLKTSDNSNFYLPQEGIFGNCEYSK